ncbi:TniB family NTP-binding protein [Mesorhizobium opportunistum]
MFYPRAKQALDRLNLLVDHPCGTRIPSVAIYGDSGMGKTMIMEKFCASGDVLFATVETFGIDCWLEFTSHPCPRH